VTSPAGAQALSDLTQLLGRLWETPGALRLLQIGGVDHVVVVGEATGLGPRLFVMPRSSRLRFACTPFPIHSLAPIL